MTQTPVRPPAAPQARATAADIKRYRANFRDEVDGAALYRRLAKAEKDARLSDVYRRIAEAEDRHRALWEEKLHEGGVRLPKAKPSFRVTLLGWVADRSGPGVVTPIVERMEMAATGMYDNQPEAVAAGLPADERSHARVFREIQRHGGPRERLDPGAEIVKRERRHRGASGNALRAGVLGVNDGLVSTLSIVMGVAGATPGREVVLLSGVAGLLAGSLSMALGEWISVKSSAEAFRRQLDLEREELELMPQEEEDELALIYEAKGLEVGDARQLAQKIISNKTTALDTLAREELGMSPEEVGNPYTAGIVSFLLFAIGAILPVFPWIFVGGWLGVTISGVVAGLGLFLAGAATSLFTGRNVAFSGGRMLLFGAIAAAITYGIGAAIGVGTGV